MIDIRPVCFILGVLLALFGAAMAIPLIVELHVGSGNAHAFALSMTLTVTIGLCLALACRTGRQPNVGLREGFLLTVGTWIAFTIAGALPFILGEPDLDVTRAIFESMSALTATGSTVIAKVDALPAGVLVWRMLVTWIGGIGVVLLAIIMLPILNIGGLQILRAADFNTIDKFLPRAKEIAVSIGTVYVVLTLACALGYVLAGLSGFDALTHAMSTVATGGMSNYDDSFTGLPTAAQYVAIVFMLLGGLSFIRFVQMAGGDPWPLLRDRQIHAFLGIYVALSLVLVAARVRAGDPLDEETLREVFFAMASVLTTTGFVDADYTLWGPFAATVFFCAMMICGCSGSTSGGPKIFRYQLLASAVSVEIGRIYSPHAVALPRYQGHAITREVMNSVIGYFMLFFLTLGVAAVALVLLGLDPTTAVSGAAASLTNVGPGLGPSIGPANTYAGLSDPAIWVMIFLMLVGRLEILTVYVLLTASFWRN